VNLPFRRKSRTARVMSTAAAIAGAARLALRRRGF
jgi:hypothetical protein